MIKKTLYFFLSFLLIIILSLIISELILQAIPIIYRNIPISKDKTYVYIIGESSSVGEPYNPKISYYKILNYILDNKIDDKDIEFIKIAFSGSILSYQYVDYLKYKILHPFQRGLALVYAGKNDWDNGKKNKKLKIYKSKVLSFILNYMFEDLFRDLFKDCDFQDNYENLIQNIKIFGDDIFVATVEGNYSSFMPHLDADNILYREEFNRIDDEIIINKNYIKASNMLKDLEEKEDSDKSWIYYRYGKIAEFTGKIKEANDYFIEDINMYPNLIPAKYNSDIIKKIAKKYNLPLIDIFDEVYNSGEIIGFNFYKDNQHPDIKLYIKIAELFAKALKEKYGNKINITKNSLTEQEIFKQFNFNDNDIYNAYRHSLDVTLIHSKENENVNRYVFKQVDEYLNKIIELNPYEGEQKQAIVSFYSMMIEALKDNRDKMFEIYKKNKDIIERNKYQIYARECDWEEYNLWVSNYLGIENFFDLESGCYF